MSNNFQELSGDLVSAVEDIRQKRNLLLQEMKDEAEETSKI